MSQNLERLYKINIKHLPPTFLKEISQITFTS